MAKVGVLTLAGSQVSHTPELMDAAMTRHRDLKSCFVYTLKGVHNNKFHEGVYNTLISLPEPAPALISSPLCKCGR